jgi:hypothetical protein
MKPYRTFNLFCCETACHPIRDSTAAFKAWIAKTKSESVEIAGAFTSRLSRYLMVENAMMPSILNGPILEQGDTPATLHFGISSQSQYVPFGTGSIRSPYVFERHHGNWVCISSQHSVLREDSNTKSKK